MIYNCKIIDIDEEEITIKIGDTYITGFANCGVDKEAKEKTQVGIELFDDLRITQCSEDKFGIERKGTTFMYSLYGTLDIENCVLKSVIDFEIAKEDLFEYGYLDGRQVKMDVLRIDFDFK